MPNDDVLNQYKAKIERAVPSGVGISGLEFEGPELVIYTNNPRAFADDGEIVRRLAKDLRKRIVPRPDPSMLLDPAEAKARIQELVPEESELGDLYFDPTTGEVVIEAGKPGLVIGKHGATLREISKEIGWVVKPIRTTRSTTVRDVRLHLRNVREERKKFLRDLGRKIHATPQARDRWLRTTFLGGCREVGRSCFLLSSPNTKVMVDCGVTTGAEEEGIPYLYVPEATPLEGLDAVVITHAHLDHCGLLPLLFKYGYDGPVYCTPPTRDLMVLLQMDYIQVADREGRKVPYGSDMIRRMVRNTITLNWGEVTDIAPDVRLTFHNSGHILGSSICHFHIGDGLYNIAFTGDFKYDRTRLFDPAVNNFPRVETLVMEATYGGSRDFQPKRADAERELERIVRDTIQRRGRVVIPTFAVGRSQEVMLVLEEAMRNGAIPQVPIYLDGMIDDATNIHTTYPEYLNHDLQNLIFHKGHNPFNAECFKPVDSPAMRQRIIDEREPCVVLATSGMLNGGPVMEHLKAFGPEQANALVFVGYQAEGTLGRRLQKGWTELPIYHEGKTQMFKMVLEVLTVDGFSGHSDRQQLMEYVRRMNPKPERILTNHGDENKCVDLASTIYRQYKLETRSPQNLETVRFL